MTREEKSKKRKKFQSHGLEAETESKDVAKSNFKLSDEDTERNNKKRKIEINDPTNEKEVENVSKDDDIVFNNKCDEDEDDEHVETEKDSTKGNVNVSIDKIHTEEEENLQNMNVEHDEIVTKKSGDKIPIIGGENFAEDYGNASKKIEPTENISVNPKPKEKSKDVKGKYLKKDLVHGKRFSKEEDEILKQAVYNYIEEHKLGEEGLKMVLNCKNYPELKNCWREIGQALPHRPYNSTYCHAHLLFETNRKGEWTKEEYDRILEFQRQNGNEWKTLASELGKSRIHIKDKWRRIKLPNMKHGSWSQAEYQNLFNLVNLDLKLRASEEKRSKHGMLRDNIAWGAISDRLSTRDTTTCCKKWYRQLTSSMVSDGKWADGDDYRLIDALFKLDACCIEDVDWDSLLSHRSGDLCKKRWDQMVLHIGEHGTKSFGEQVDILSKRYCPDLSDVRDAWDKKPVVP